MCLAKLAMADVFLIALYIVVAKGVGHVTVEVAWGLYLFTALHPGLAFHRLAGRARRRDLKPRRPWR